MQQMKCILSCQYQVDPNCTARLVIMLVLISGPRPDHRTGTWFSSALACLFFTTRQDLLFSTSCHSITSTGQDCISQTVRQTCKTSCGMPLAAFVKLGQIGIRRIRPLRLKTRGVVKASEMPDERHWMLRQCSDDELWKEVLYKLPQGYTDCQRRRYSVGF